MYRVDLSNTEQCTLPDLLKIQSEQNGDGIFLITESQQLSFSETQKKCLALASGFSDLGVSKGDYIGLYLYNCPEMVLAAIAANMLGAIWVPICTDYKGSWLSDTITRSRPKILITEAALVERISGNCLADNDCKVVMIDSNQSHKQTSFDELFDHLPWNPNYQDIDYGDTSAVVWTSGTTGKSKGVLVSHNCWLRPIEQGSAIFYQSQASDVIFNVLPMYHAGAWNTSVLRALVEGLPVVL